MTEQTKNTATITDQDKPTGMTWEQATFSWEDAVGTWTNPYGFSEQDANSGTITNQTKS